MREAVRNLEIAELIEIKRGPKGGDFVLPMKHDAASQVMLDALKMGDECVGDIVPLLKELEIEVHTGRE